MDHPELTVSHFIEYKGFNSYIVTIYFVLKMSAFYICIVYVQFRLDFFMEADP